MDRGKAGLTVFFEGPFWVGVFERVEDGLGFYNSGILFRIDSSEFLRRVQEIRIHGLRLALL